jgi:hypothetical protein
MTEAWKQLDLEGGGVQAANLRLAQLMKRRARGYALLTAFPLGLHRSYLDDPRGAWGYRGLTLATAAGAAAGWPWVAWAAVAALVGWALFDIRWIDNRVAALNKRLRMQVYLGAAPGAPKDFRGHHTDDPLTDYLEVKKAERPGAAAAGPPTASGRAPSFAEQERLLRELARRRSGSETKN